MTAPASVSEQRPSAGAPRVGLALQGSFGHEAYALGILAAFQRHRIAFDAASGCVATLLPLWLYFSRSQIDIAGYFARHGTEMHSIMAPAALDAQTWASYWDGLLADVGAVARRPADYATQRRALGNALGIAGSAVFNRSYFESRRAEFEALMRDASVPIFTNALNARNFNEVYLHCGPLTPAELGRVRGRKWREGRRDVAAMNLDRFIASGARAPLLAPIRVRLDPQDTPDGQARDEYWMEGAMRCNPPLNPLLDVECTTVLLIRLFAKRKATGRTANEAELLDRYLETIFSAPLEKEIEFIEAMGRRSDGMLPVTILDPATDGRTSSGRCLAALVSDELDLLSHFDSLNPAQTRRMFEVGQELGEQIVAEYGAYLQPPAPAAP